MMRLLKLIAVNALVAVLLLFVVDQLLGLLGLPSDTPIQSAHGTDRWELRKNIEYEHEFATNSLGLRYEQVSREKPPGEVRILMLGDSFTEGQGVETVDTFGSYLENHFRGRSTNRVRFINAGLSGQGPLKYWRVFRDVGLTLDPDGVLICLYGNDVTDTPESLTEADLYRRYPEREGVDATLHRLVPRLHTLGSKAVKRIQKRLRKHQGFKAMAAESARQYGVSEDAIRRWEAAVPANLVEAVDRNEFNGALLTGGLFHPDLWISALDLASPMAQRKYQSVERVLDELIRVAREEGIGVGLVYIPGPMQYDRSRHGGWNPLIIGGVRFRKEWLRGVSEVQKRLARWSRARDVPFLDLTATLRAEIERGRTINFRLDGHWNPEGHRIAGRAIAEWIDSNGVFRDLGSPEPADK